MARRGLSTTSGSSSLAAGCAGVVIVVDVVVGQRATIVVFVALEDGLVLPGLPGLCCLRAAGGGCGGALRSRAA